MQICSSNKKYSNKIPKIKNANSKYNNTAIIEENLKIIDARSMNSLSKFHFLKYVKLNRIKTDHTIRNSKIWNKRDNGLIRVIKSEK